MSDSANEIIERLRNQVKQLERELNEAKREIELIEKAWRNERECTKTWKAMAQELANEIEGSTDYATRTRATASVLSRFNELNKP